MNDTALVIFAKYPREGQVKTRLSRYSIPHFRQLSLLECSQLYAAFLKDYIQRFRDEHFATQIFFCLRSSVDVKYFEKDYTQGYFPVIEEPSYRGKKADDIGQSMSYTIRYLLQKGYQKVIIMGTDLPHFPSNIIEETQELLETSSLVLGSDGGGFYLIGATEIPLIFEQNKIIWSQGQDLQMIQQLQKKLQFPLKILSTVLKDIDEPNDLAEFIKILRKDISLQIKLPSTLTLLDSWGITFKYQY